MAQRLKDDSVQIYNLRPAMFWALSVAEDVYREHGVDDIIITSGHEDIPAHKEDSDHFDGRAVDLRSWTIPSSERQSVVENLSFRLGRDFGVIRESTHIHVYLRPRRRSTRNSG